jgi:hypothetical protein
MMFEALPLWVLEFFILPLRQDLLTTFWKKLKHPAWVTRPEILQELSRRIHMHHNMERCVEAELEEMFSGQGHIITHPGGLSFQVWDFSLLDVSAWDQRNAQNLKLLHEWYCRLFS